MRRDGTRLKAAVLCAALAASPLAAADAGAKASPLPPGHPPTGQGESALPPGHPPTGEGTPEAGELPPGHPPTGPTGQGEGGALPSGHPPIDDSEDAEQGASPHAHPGAPGAPKKDEGPTPDASLPEGTIAVRVVDATGLPLPSTEVTLGIVYNSVAKGESRKRLSATTDAQGLAKFASLDVGSGVAYRPMVMKDGATFSATPFQLGPRVGTRTDLHVFPVVHDIEQALVVAQGMVYVEVKDDRVQIQEAYRIYNFGKAAWVPNDLVVPLPADFTGFSAQQGMTDIGVDAVPKQGFRLHGTFAPGQHMVEFRWQLPYDGDADVRFDAGMPPHLADVRVIAPASREVSLDVDGFPSPQTSSDGAGQRVLVTEKQLKRDDAPLKDVHVAIKGLPTPGPARVVASALAVLGVVLGAVLSTRKPSTVRDHRGERKRLLAELAELERAHRQGEVGPKTYEKSRRELLDAVARTLAADTESRAKKAARAG